jgi:probable rRNA maturation factor
MSALSTAASVLNAAKSASSAAKSTSRQSHDREGVVSVIFRRVPADVPHRSIERFARKLQNLVAKGRAFDCLITGDAELRRLNRKFRAKDQATDVLSFPSGTGIPAGSYLRSYLGSIAISLQRARAQARDFGHSTEDEIRILMLHGILHLTGLDHETDAGRMARAERRWRARLGLPASLIERALIERVRA